MELSLKSALSCITSFNENQPQKLPRFRFHTINWFH